MKALPWILLLLGGTAFLLGSTNERCRYCRLDRFRRASRERTPWSFLKTIARDPVDYRGCDRDIVRLHLRRSWDRSAPYYMPPVYDGWVVCPESSRGSP